MSLLRRLKRAVQAAIRPEQAPPVLASAPTSASITAEDQQKLRLLLSLVNDQSQPNVNALNEVVRGMTAVNLNIKARGYELARELASALPANRQTTARRVGLASKPSTQADLESDWVAHWCGQLQIPVVYHRKIWELCYALQAMHENGHMIPGAKGLGFGCGTEPIPSYLTARGVAVTVTDQLPEDAEAQGWAQSNQHTATLDQVHNPALVSREQFDRLASLRYVDMNAIPDDLRGYDFCWSICALEHLGSIEKGLAFIKNSLKTLRPGGLAIHTTEFNINSQGPTIDNWPTVLFQRQHFERLAQELGSHGHYVAPLDFDVGQKPLDRFIDMPPWTDQLPLEMSACIGDPLHLKLSVDGFICTCFGVVIRKAV